MSIKIVLMQNKAKKTGEAPLYLRIIRNRKPSYISLGHHVHPDLWDSAKQEVKKGYPNAKRMNNLLLKKRTDASGYAIEVEVDNTPVTSKKFKQAVLGVSSESFIRYFEDHLQSLAKSGKAGTHDKYSAVLSKLKKFLGGKDLTFDEITVTWLKKYEFHLRYTLSNSTNTIHSNLKNFRKLIREAIVDDLIPQDKDPFRKYSLQWEHIQKDYCSLEELVILEELCLVPKSMKWHHRNMYLFAAFTGGMRISDVLTITWRQFNDTHLIWTQKKSTSAKNRTVSVKVQEESMSILNLYRNEKTKPDDYIFPILKKDKDYSNPEILRKAISSATAYTNKDLKDIAKLAGIKHKLHFHTSRHTFATIIMQLGVRIEYVGKSMGHSSIKMTEAYTNIINHNVDEAMDEASEKLSCHIRNIKNKLRSQ